MDYKQTDAFKRNSEAIEEVKQLDVRLINRENARIAQVANHKKLKCTKEQVAMAYYIGYVRLGLVQ